MAYDDSMGTAIPGAAGFYAPTPNLSPEELDAYLKRLRAGSVNGTQNPEAPSAAGAVSPLQDTGDQPSWGSGHVLAAMRRAGPGNPAPDTSPGSAVRAKWRDLGIPGTPTADTTTADIQPQDEGEAMRAAQTGHTYAENPDLWTKKGGSTTADEYGQEMQSILQRREYEKSNADTENATNKVDSALQAHRVAGAVEAMRRGAKITKWNDDGTYESEPLPENMLTAEERIAKAAHRGNSPENPISVDANNRTTVIIPKIPGTPSKQDQPAQTPGPPPVLGRQIQPGEKNPRPNDYVQLPDGSRQIWDGRHWSLVEGNANARR